ncbi:MAG: S41 family peptidase [Bacteroidota bacterium]
MQKIILALSLAVLLCCSCEKIILGERLENTPENNFELFWQDFDRHYGLFHIRGLNWDSIYTVYRPQVNAQTSEEELWQIFTQMIEYLDDSHTVIIKEDDYYVSGFELGAKAEENWSLELIEEKYVEDMTYILDEEFGYGKIKDRAIGYIYLGKEDGFDANRIEEVMDALGDHQAIILDMRLNGGGSALISERIAGAFADGEHFVYTIQTRNGTNHDDFDEKTLVYTQPLGRQQFIKPVTVLTDRHTISAGEELLFHLKAFEHVTQIGDTTAGDLSDRSNQRFLPNAWMYIYSPQMYLSPDGTSLDGVGHVPDVYAKNEKSDIEAGNDLVLERTFEYLLETYGIK